MGISKVCSVALGLMLMVVASDRPAAVESKIECSQVRNLLTSCVGYVKHGQTPVSAACCNGVRRLNNMASSRADRKDACNCIKQVANLVNKINYSYVALLPGKCGVQLPYRITRSINCNTVK